MESYKEYAGYECWETGPNLGRVLPSHCHRKCKSILFGEPRRETTSSTMECSQSEEILPLSIHTQGYMLNVMSYVQVVN